VNLSLTTFLSKISNLFRDPDKIGGLLLLVCIIVAITMTNVPMNFVYLNLWNINFAGMDLKHWINDGLMTIFFLLIGLELEREIYIGELSNIKNALLPICAAIGGMLVPALIHFLLNQATDTQNGMGIPMATDITFTMAILAIFGNRIPASLKIFVMAFAVIDDLGAILTIVLFYTTTLLIWYVVYALAVWALLMMLNKLFRVKNFLPYLVGGILMWFFVLKSGVHPTVTGIIFGVNWWNDFTSLNSVGIIMGLVVGKPLGITLFCFIAVKFGLSRLPSDVKWGHIIGAGMLGGIGLTMSIFITNLAFHDSLAINNASKMSILLASLTAGLLGFLCLKFMQQNEGNLA
jgi:NhaA family Na+:H+ antiporter